MALKRPAKDQREKRVLLGLVELYLETGKPVSSSTLREAGFQNLSSATIRNYFVQLEKGGFLKQQHSSGGRVPTEDAYKLYIKTYLKSPQIKNGEVEAVKEALSHPTRQIASYLQKGAEVVAELSQCAVFLSSPRFDQDFVVDVKLVDLDAHRCLSILLTDFGMIHTELLYVETGLEGIDLSKVGRYLQWRISGTNKPLLSPAEEGLAHRIYKEVMLRHIVSYSNFSSEDIYKTGFSNLLHYPEFNNVASLASGLSLFENETDLRLLLGQACSSKELCCFLSGDLPMLQTEFSNCSLLLIPYKIHQTVAGAIGLLGPSRLPYRRLFALLQVASEVIGENLTRSLYKFKITFRKPNIAQIELGSKASRSGLLVENKDKQ